MPLLERDEVLASELVWNHPHCLLFSYDAGGEGLGCPRAEELKVARTIDTLIPNG